MGRRRVSQLVLSWRVVNMLRADFCVEALEHDAFMLTRIQR